VAKSLKPLVGQNVSLTIHEQLSSSEGINTLPIHIWVRGGDSGFLHPTHLEKNLKGKIRENEPPGTSVTFELMDSKLSQPVKPVSDSILAKILPEVLPPNILPSSLVLTHHRTRENDNQNGEEEDNIPFTLSFKEIQDQSWKDTVEIHSLSWLDHENTPSYELSLSEKHGDIIGQSLLNFTVTVLNVNDNLPVFNETDVIWRFPSNTRRYTIIGRAVAADADGDEVVYEFLGGKKVEGTGCCVVVPQTGDVMLVETPYVPTHVTIVAR